MLIKASFYCAVISVFLSSLGISLIYESMNNNAMFKERLVQKEYLSLDNKKLALLDE
jgi:hypothetical protein